MKKCWLKIIRANISENNIDTPLIIYVSQNKSNTKKKDLHESTQKINNKGKNELIGSVEEIILPKENGKTNIKLQDIIKSDREKENNENIENKVDVNNLEVENSLKKEESENNNQYNLRSSYPYAIMNKKKDLDTSLRYIFKNRFTKDKTSSAKNSNSSLPKITPNSLNNSKNKNYFSKKQFAKSLSNSVNQKALRFKNKNTKAINNNLSINFEESNSSSFWKILEKNELNYTQNIDYKALIDDLMIQECNLVNKKKEIIKIYEEKIKSLKELNEKLKNQKNFTLNREDELNGEYILLKNQYENLFKSFKQKFKIKDAIFNKKETEIYENMKKLNTKLLKGQLILITKPNNIIKITSEKNKYITYLLRGLFCSYHIINTDELVDMIWKSTNQFQTIYFLVKELMNLFNLNPKENQNILINYFYSFCKNKYYMDIEEFKLKFKKKIGEITIYNKYIQMSKLLHYHKMETTSLISLISKKDSSSEGKINFTKFKKIFYDDAFANVITKEDKDKYIEFFIYCMKKRIELKKKKNKIKEEKNYDSLYDLYYTNLNDFINEYNAKIISNPYKLIRNYMERNKIISSEKLLRPIIDKCHIIKKNSKEYIDEILLNKILRNIGIIKNDEKVLLPTIEEELIDINELINDIYTKEDKNNDFINTDNKKKVNNMLDNIFHNALINAN